MQKPKLLILGADDTNQAGHAYHNFLSLPDLFDKRIVVQCANNAQNKNIALYYSGDLYWRVLRLFRKIMFYAEVFFRFHKIFSLEKIEDGYEYIPILRGDSAKAILKKIGNFRPDIIYVKWIKGFVHYCTLKELQELTGAHIVISFLDEEPMTGGCHYPINCKEYRKNCENCPAINIKSLSAYQLKKKKEALADMSYSIYVSPYDAEIASMSSLFKNASIIEGVSVPKIDKYSKSEARKNFAISNSEFVILLGAQSIDNPRKGFKYGIAALEQFCKGKDNIVIIALGKVFDSSIFSKIDARLIMPGFLSFSDMCKAYCASNCYLNPSIADSGPMMVNYAMSFGIPTVSFKMGIAKSLVKTKKNGWLTDLYNIEGLVDGLDYFYNCTSEEFVVIQENCKKVMEFYKNQKPWYERLLASLDMLS